MGIQSLAWMDFVLRGRNLPKRIFLVDECVEYLYGVKYISCAPAEWFDTANNITYTYKDIINATTRYQTEVQNATIYEFNIKNRVRYFLSYNQIVGLEMQDNTIAQRGTLNEQAKMYFNQICFDSGIRSTKDYNVLSSSNAISKANNPIRKYSYLIYNLAREKKCCICFRHHNKLKIFRKQVSEVKLHFCSKKCAKIWWNEHQPK